ncbi:hypothetical protein N7462_010902 [Penicillium macrosclerotiorum]|uniref:uncharacterized protein n=1 Tax=Penicillium macrosclerotiorum TaxID=303699 RepID=UPI002547D76F|nr:uncharacterized protein N7462_010902 [Penicillium macrosclerotiorum]KAJ5669832.1 hypothetical protein N7462_010902 [Penicillium macrosclerotiorum]
MEGNDTPEQSKTKEPEVQEVCSEESAYEYIIQDPRDYITRKGPLSAEEKEALKKRRIYEILNPSAVQAKKAEAEAAAQRDDEGEVLYSCMGFRSVVRISEHLVVKKAFNIQLSEVANLKFIASNTTIPVPQVHGIRWEDNIPIAIVMDYMPGRPLDNVWNTLTPNQKQSVSKQLRDFLLQLHQLKGDYFGAADRGTVVMCPKIAVISGGPFDSEREFNQWLLDDIPQQISPSLKHYASYALTEGHEIIFTHADFSPRNILVDENCRVTALLDWEYAGWYPAWWEHFTAHMNIDDCKGWKEYLCSSILPPKFEREILGMTFVASLCRR